MNISKSFNFIFWGLLLATVHFTINKVQIPPAFIGYILIAIGCNGLVEVSSCFSTASILCWILVVLNIARYLLQGITGVVFDFVGLLAVCAMMWFLLEGVMELATARQREDLCEIASNRRIALISLMIIASLMLCCFELFHEEIFAIMSIVFSLCILVPFFMILHLIHRAKHELILEPTPTEAASFTPEI